MNGNLKMDKQTRIQIIAFEGDRAVADVVIFDDGSMQDNMPGESQFVRPSAFIHAVDAVLHRLHGIATRSPSEAHMIAGAIQLDEVLSRANEGIWDSIMTDAAKAAHGDTDEHS